MSASLRWKRAARNACSGERLKAAEEGRWREAVSAAHAGAAIKPAIASATPRTQASRLPASRTVCTGASLAPSLLRAGVSARLA
jgi:hypothetical protein